jgi:hypothetical protein
MSTQVPASANLTNPTKPPTHGVGAETQAMSATETKPATQAIAEGAKCVTWGRYGSKCANFRSGGFRMSKPIYSARVMVAVRRKRDGALQWRLHCHVGRQVTSTGHTYDCPNSVITEAREYAEAHGLPMIGVSHGQVIEAGPA